MKVKSSVDEEERRFKNSAQLPPRSRSTPRLWMPSTLKTSRCQPHVWIVALYLTQFSNANSIEDVFHSVLDLKA